MLAGVCPSPDPTRRALTARKGYTSRYRCPPAARQLTPDDIALLGALAKRQIALGSAQPALALGTALPLPLAPAQPFGLARPGRRPCHDRLLKEIRLSPPKRHLRPLLNSYTCPLLIEQRVEVIRRLMHGVTDPKSRAHHEVLIAVVRKLGDLGISVTDGMQSDAMRLLSKKRCATAAVQETERVVAILRRALANPSQVPKNLVIGYEQPTCETEETFSEDADESASGSPRSPLFMPRDVADSSYVRRQQLLRSRRLAPGHGTFDPEATVAGNDGTHLCLTARTHPLRSPRGVATPRAVLPPLRQSMEISSTASTFVYDVEIS